MNTLSSSSICVFLRISDLALSFSSSSCFFCFKVWEKNRTEHCQLTNNAVKSTTRKFFFFNQMQSENHSWSIWFRQHSLRPPPVTCFPRSFDWFPTNNGDWSFEIGSRDFSDPALNLATGHTFFVPASPVRRTWAARNLAHTQQTSPSDAEIKKVQIELLL